MHFSCECVVFYALIMWASEKPCAGTCPKCGKVVTKGHASHLENCMGTTKRSRSMKEYTIGELVALEADKIEKQEKKLLELELGGLVKVDDEKAVFMVVGSKGAKRLYS